jgi:hypothetical protein
MASLRKIFSKIKPDAAEKERQRQLARLEAWLGKLPEKFRQDLEHPLQENGQFKVAHYAIDVDGSDFTKAELAEVAKKIEALHDICMKKDVAFDVAGFSPLPADYTVTPNGSASSGRSVTVGFDTGKTYCHYMHPRCNELRANGLEPQFSRARKTPAPDPKIREIVIEGLSEKINVNKPLRFKQ